MSKVLDELLTHLPWLYKTEPKNLVLSLQDFLPLKQESTSHKVGLGTSTEKRKQNSLKEGPKTQFCTFGR